MLLPTTAELLAELHALENPTNVQGMARYGISTEGTLGVNIPTIRALAKRLKPAQKAEPEALHQLAQALFDSEIHEARLLAGFIDVPAYVTEAQADAWVAALDSWDTCDLLSGLWADAFCIKAPPTEPGEAPRAYHIAERWAGATETFVKRSGFTLMCALAVHHKKGPDALLLPFLPLIEREAWDERNFVKKAVNWALRQIGKRSLMLNEAALACGARVAAQGSRSARWIAADALRELKSEAVQARLAARATRLS